MGSEYLHVFFNLFLVIALMLLMLFFLKKFKTSQYSGNKHIKIINMVSIGVKEKIILMEVNNTFLLVGATPTHIETLHVFDELEAAKTAAQPVAAQQSFSELLTT